MQNQFRGSFKSAGSIVAEKSAPKVVLFNKKYKSIYLLKRKWYEVKWTEVNKYIYIYNEYINYI